MPTPTKVVVVIFENHAYNQIVGSTAAPYINSLINDSMTALFTQSFALTRPSQPNYLQLFSGSTQGVTSNNIPSNLPFTTPNLYSELVAASKTFIAYSQTLPSVGFTGETSGAYVRKHAPWVNWQGTGVNGIPSSLHVPFTSFPTNYNNLPTVSFVVPDQNSDMHNGTDPTRITIGDTWLQNNLNGYIQWARTNNSLLIFTFDEDDFSQNNKITTFFFGPMVWKGSYSNYVNHYSILRTIEDMYGLTHAGNAATATPIDYVWKCPTQSIITAGGPTSICKPNTVSLNAPAGLSYIWSTGATTQNISVDTTGNYYCTMRQTNGCYSVTNTIPVTVYRQPVITSIIPSNAMVGNSIAINGSGFILASQVYLNGSSVAFTIVNDNKITFTIPVGANTGYLQITNNCFLGQSPTPLYIFPTQVQLNIKMLIEGFCKVNGKMQPILTATTCDSISVELRQSTSPYSILYSTKSVVDTNGNASFVYSGFAYNNEYYLSVTGRNFLNTWSAQPLLITNTTSYDFTNLASKAFGSNQKNIGSFFAFYSGDVNQDGNINTIDYTHMKSALTSFLTGYYVYDLNGDFMIESADFSLFENNMVPRVVAKP